MNKILRFFSVTMFIFIHEQLMILKNTFKVH